MACASTPRPTAGVPIESIHPSRSTDSIQPSSPTESPDQASRGWHQVDRSILGADRGVSLTRVAWSGEAAVILGAVRERPSVWIEQPDGGWLQSLAPARQDPARAVAAIAHDDWLLVSIRDELTGTTTVWRLDQETWTPSGEGAFPPGSVVTDFASTGSLLVAVGAVTDGFAEDPEGSTAAVWTSLDGSDWERSELFGDLRGARLLDVAFGLDGLVAAGARTRNGGADGVLLFSEDGLTWRRIETGGLAAADDESVLAVASTDRAWLATGRVAPARCLGTGCVDTLHRQWASTDGTAWTFTDDGGMPPQLFGANDESFFGIRFEGPSLEVAASPDGQDWRAITGVLRVADDVIVGGWSRSIDGFVVAAVAPNDQTLLVWRSN